MDVFICHHHADLGLVKGLAGYLKQVSPHIKLVWYDEAIYIDSIYWRDVLTRIESCKLFVTAITPGYVEDTTCHVMASFAHELNKTTLPVLLIDADIRSIPSYRTHFDFNALVDFRRQDRKAFDELYAAVHRLPASKPPPVPDLYPQKPPLPVSPLSRIQELLLLPSLEPTLQKRIMDELRAALRRPDQGTTARQLIDTMTERADIRFDLRRDLNASSGSSMLSRLNEPPVDENSGFTEAQQDLPQSEPPPQPPPRRSPKSSGDTLEVQSLIHLNGHITTVSGAEFNGEGDIIVTVSHDHTATMWPWMEMLRQPGANLGRQLGTYNSPVTTVARHPHPRNRSLNVITREGILDSFIFRRVDGVEPVHQFRVRHMLLANTSSLHFRLVASINFVISTPDGIVRVLRLSSTPSAGTFMEPVNYAVHHICSLGFDPQNTNPLPSRILTSFSQRHGIHCAQFDPTGTLVTTANDRGILKTWDISKPNPKPRSHIQAHTGSATALGYHPSRRAMLLASGGEDFMLRLWNVDTGNLYREHQHNGVVRVTKFSPDGRLLLSAGDDPTVHVWNTKSGQPAARLIGHNEPVVDANFSANGRYIVTASEDGSARVWDIQHLLS